ncbi:MAG: 30S ribosomal protein S13 [Candidatus Korarchaeum sp.]|nr:30S ribosomal protein S13 [Candidatus Korarchaeum sp.]MDW8035435.1 30S ribosomal protein S13 [Candidatus Korarchaeum sp.]
MSGAELKRVVRLLNTTLDGTKPVLVSLTNVKGMSYTLATTVLRKAGINPNKRLGELSEEDYAKIEEVVNNPERYGIPWWLMNRQKDYRSNGSMILIGDDVNWYVTQDINLMKKIGSWKGVRHELGLKVRGQRTKTTGRAGRTVGYQRKK